MATFEGTDLGRIAMTEDHRYSVSVAGVVVDDAGRALIIQRRDNGHWEPPGGILEHGETIEDGLVREVYEETGLKVEPGPLTGVYQNMTRSIVALVFRCRTIDGELTSNREVVALRWASASDAGALMTPAYAVRVLDALTYTVQPAVRAHDGTNLR
jgi:8-oxo-dGTP pyrophosphatase MutT (NUDIX family)